MEALITILLILGLISLLVMLVTSTSLMLDGIFILFSAETEDVLIAIFGTALLVFVFTALIIGVVTIYMAVCKAIG